MNPWTIFWVLTLAATILIFAGWREISKLVGLTASETNGYVRGLGIAVTLWSVWELADTMAVASWLAPTAVVSAECERWQLMVDSDVLALGRIDFEKLRADNEPLKRCSDLKRLFGEAGATILTHGER